MPVTNRRKAVQRKPQSSLGRLRETLRELLWDDPLRRYATMGGGAALVVLLLVVRGCSGPAYFVPDTGHAQSFPDDSITAPPRKEAPPAAKTAAPEPKKPQYFDDDSAPVNSLKAKTAAKVQPTPPPVPQDVAAWKDADFLMARRVNSPDLLSALQLRAKRSPGDEKDADLLARLLAAGPGKAGSENAASPVPTQIPALVRLLGDNGTPAARRVLGRLITGRLKTDDDKLASEAALGVLADHPCKENDDMLFRVVTAAEELCPVDDGRTSPQTIRQAALAAVKQSASVRLRVELARFISDASVPRKTAELIAGPLKGPERVNLEAQAILYQSELLESADRTAFEKQWTLASHDAMAGLLNLAAPSGDGGEGHWAARVAAVVWSRPLDALLCERLQTIDSLKDGREAVLLASTIPQTATRQALLKTLERHWEDGPDACLTPSSPQGDVSEPGFVVLLKAVPKAAAARSHGPKRAPSTARLAAAGAAFKKWQEHQEAVDGAWIAARDRIVQSYCRLLEASGRSSARAEHRLGREPDPAKALEAAGVATRPRARVVVALCVELPESACPSVVDAPLERLSVAYLRAEERGQPSKLAQYYQRQLKLPQSHAAAGAMHLESLEDDPRGARWRTTDVILSPSKPNPDRPPDEEQEIIVEILSVTIPAPHPTHDATARSVH
jgi:hypothetical protein